MPAPSQLHDEPRIPFLQRLHDLCGMLWTYSLYLLLIVMGAYAFWDSGTPVTMIAPFQLPKANLPFSGEMVADALQDSLGSIRNDIDEERNGAGLKSSDTGLPDLRHMLIPKFSRIQAPPRFAVEVKGVSYERLLSVARGLRRTQTIVSGDLLLRGNKFILIARTADSGPWESMACPASKEGLKQASRDLAEKILASQDPTLAGVALLKDGQADQGLAMLNRARTLKPKDSRLKLNLCMGFGANRRYQEAIDCYEEVLDDNPGLPPEVNEGLAQAYFLLGEREAAIEIYETLVGRGYKLALLGLGEALDNEDRHVEALQKYDEFLSGKHLDRELAIAHVKKGAVLSHQGRHGDALSEYQWALKYVPRDPLILVNEGVELAQSGDPDAGIAQLQSVLGENSTSDAAPFALLQLGTLLQQKGDWQRAIDPVRKATELRPNYVEAHLRLASLLARSGRRSDALAEYARVARLSPSDLERGNSQVLAHQWLGNALQDNGNYAGAASEYREAIHLQPNYGAAHCQLGFVLERQGHLQQAIREYTAALMKPSATELDGTERLVTAHYRLGAALLSKGRAHRAEAIAEFRNAIALNRDHLESHLALARVLYDEGNLVEAAAEYKEAIRINPQSIAAHNGLNLIVSKQGLRAAQARLEFGSMITREGKSAQLSR